MNLSSQGNAAAEPVYFQIAKLATPAAVEVSIEDWWNEQQCNSSQAPYVASRSGGLLELSDAYLEEPPVAFIHQTAKEYAQSLVSNQSLLVDFHSHAASIRGVEMVLGFDLARLRVQCQDQTLAGKNM